jgi:hypothetical protein
MYEFRISILTISLAIKINLYRSRPHNLILNFTCCRVYYSKDNSSTNIYIVVHRIQRADF